MINLLLSTQFTELGYPDVFSDCIWGSKNVLAIFSLNCKAVIFVSHFRIRTESYKLGEVDGASLLSFGAVHVIVELET
jgi:hypothetical protein